MNAAAAIEVKGWCPGALRPMPSGDGLLLRVRPRCGAFSLVQANGLADVADRLGNGHIDLTRRANLQLRGVREDGLLELQCALDELGLLDPDPETEAARNVMVGPLAGLDPAEPFDIRPIASALERQCLSALPAKFAMLVDGGGTVSIAGERADVTLRAIGSAVALGLDTRTGTQWLGATSPEQAASAALALARAFLEVDGPGRMRNLGEADLVRLKSAVMPMLSTIDPVPPAKARALGVFAFGAAGVAAPFGRLEARHLRHLVSLAAEAGASDIRLSPWRALYVGVRDAAAARTLVEAAHSIGLIVNSNDPLLRIEACPGAPACKSTSLDTRRDARRLAAIAAGFDFAGTIHVSGCAKGCARSQAADFVLVGQSQGYGLVRNGTARDAAERTIGAEEL